MKLIVLLFGFYILLLPCAPCMDVEEVNPVLQTSQITIAPVNAQDHQQENETCNPFCSCSCCGHIISPLAHLNKASGKKYIDGQPQFNAHKDISLPSDLFGTIWQPPKLS